MQTRIHVNADADVARAAMTAGRIGASAGLDETASAMLATAVSELARNIVKYAGRGEVVIRMLAGARMGVEVVAADTGPGIEDPQRALEDHYSTGGTLGLGLPGVRRMMDEFAMDTAPGRGTRVTICKWGRDR